MTNILKINMTAPSTEQPKLTPTEAIAILRRVAVSGNKQDRRKILAELKTWKLESLKRLLSEGLGNLSAAAMAHNLNVNWKERAAKTYAVIQIAAYTGFSPSDLKSSGLDVPESVDLKQQIKELLAQRPDGMYPSELSYRIWGYRKNKRKQPILVEALKILEQTGEITMEVRRKRCTLCRLAQQEAAV